MPTRELFFLTQYLFVFVWTGREYLNGYCVVISVKCAY